MGNSARPAAPDIMVTSSRLKSPTSVLSVIGDVALGVLLVLMLPFGLILVGLPVVLIVRALVAAAGQF